MSADTKLCAHCGKRFVRVKTGPGRLSTAKFERQRYCSVDCCLDSRGHRKPRPPKSSDEPPIGAQDLHARRDAAKHASAQLLARLEAFFKHRADERAGA